jgi:hypothetical protein
MNSRWLEYVLWLTCAQVLCACGSGDESAPEKPKPSGVVFDVGSTTNDCPSFAYYAITPRSIPPLTAADIQVSVFDPDGTELDLAWTATSGYFEDKNSANTRYACNRTGPQTLTLTATDAAACERHIDLDVSCLPYLPE